MWSITKIDNCWFLLKSPSGSEANFVSFNGAFSRIPLSSTKVVYNAEPMARITILAKRYLLGLEA